MKRRFHALCRASFTIAAAMSLLLCIGAAVLAIGSDHVHRKQVRIGQLEIFWHHDLLIISWGPVDFSGDVLNQLSIDQSWIGFDADIVKVVSGRWKWLFTLNCTQTAMIGITAVLPGLWVFRYLMKRNQAKANRLADSPM